MRVADGERGWFGPSKGTHAARENPQADALTCAPSGVDGEDLDIGHVEGVQIGDCCGKVDEAVGAVDGGGRPADGSVSSS